MSKSIMEDLIFYSGLEEGFFKESFEALVREHGRDPETIDLDGLREILADELQDALLRAKKEI